MYLKDKIDKLFETYSKSFTNQNKTLLTSIAKNENSINYKNLSHEFLLSNGRPDELNFFKKYGPLYSLLESLLIKITDVDSANAGQLSFIIDLMRGYDKSKLIDIETIKDKIYFHSALLTTAERVFLDTKKNPEKRIKSFFSTEIQRIPSKRSRGCFIKFNAAIQLQK